MCESETNAGILNRPCNDHQGATFCGLTKRCSMSHCLSLTHDYNETVFYRKRKSQLTAELLLIGQRVSRMRANLEFGLPNLDEHQTSRKIQMILIKQLFKRLNVRLQKLSQEEMNL